MGWLGLPEVVSLPLDRPRPPVPSYRGDAVEVRIDPPVWAGVKALAAAHNATVSMVLQAVVAVVLHRVGACEDVVMGAPIAGRRMRRSMIWSGSSSTRGCCGWP